MATWEQQQVIDLMKGADIPITRQNYIDTNWGDPDLKWTAELEEELPEELQDWSLFKMVDGEMVLKSK